jgi:hypothetical protein
VVYVSGRSQDQDFIRDFIAKNFLLFNVADNLPLLTFNRSEQNKFQSQQCILIVNGVFLVFDGQKKLLKFFSLSTVKDFLYIMRVSQNVSK